VQTFLLWQLSVTNALPLIVSITVYCADFSHHQTSPPKYMYHTVAGAVNNSEQMIPNLKHLSASILWTHHLLANIYIMRRNYQEINNNNNLQNCQYQPPISNITYKIKLCPMATGNISLHAFLKQIDRPNFVSLSKNGGMWFIVVTVLK